MKCGQGTNCYATSRYVCSARRWVIIDGDQTGFTLKKYLTVSLCQTVGVFIVETRLTSARSWSSKHGTLLSNKSKYPTGTPHMPIRSTFFAGPPYPRKNCNLCRQALPNDGPPTLGLHIHHLPKIAPLTFILRARVARPPISVRHPVASVLHVGSQNGGDPALAPGNAGWAEVGPVEPERYVYTAVGRLDERRGCWRIEGPEHVD